MYIISKRYYSSILLICACLSVMMHIELFCAHDNQTFQIAKEWTKKVRAKLVRKVYENGFTVLFYPQENSPEVHVQIVYNVGSRDEQSEAEYGLAHLLEHLSFKGTTSAGLGLSETDINAICEKMGLGAIGCGCNASTSYDATSYYFSAHKNNWPIFVHILADWMQHLHINQQHLNSEMNAVYQEIKMRGQDSSSNFIAEVLPEGHPYATHSVIGLKETILQTNAATVQDFYQRNYTPENATLIVVGNIDAQELFASIQDTFATIPRGSVVCDRAYIRPLKSDFSQKKITTYKHTSCEEIYYTWAVPGLQDDQTRSIAQSVVYVLRDRLQKCLYDEKKIVYDIHVGRASLILDSIFYIFFRPKEPQTYGNEHMQVSDAVIGQCSKQINRILSDIALHGVTSEELTRWKKVSAINFLHDFEKCRGIADVLVSHVTLNSNDKFFDTIEHIQIVSSQAIQEYVSTYLRPFLQQTFHIKPVPEEEKQSWLKRRDQVDKHDYALISQLVRTEPIEPPKVAHSLQKPDVLPFKYDPPESIFTLSNGLQVYVKKRQDIPFIVATCGFKNYQNLIDSYNAQGRRFLPACAMDNLLEGSIGYTKKDHQEFFDDHAIRSFFNKTGAGFSCMSNDFEIVCQRFLTILTQPTFTQDSFDRYIRDSHDQILMEQTDSKKQAYRLVNEHLFKKYWVQTDSEEIEALGKTNRGMLVDFCNQFIQPDSLFLVVVGDVAIPQLREQLERTFGAWKGNDFTEQKPPVIATITNPVGSTLKKFLPVDQVTLCACRVTETRDHNDSLSLKLLNNYVYNLLFDLRERYGIFYSMQVNLSARTTSQMKGAAYLMTDVHANNLQQAEQAVRDVLTFVCQNGISEEMLQYAKQIYQNNLAKMFTDNSTISNGYARLIRENLAFDYYETDLARIKAITCEQINEVAKRYLDPNIWTFCFVGRVDEESSNT